jgi:hypothetical protein
MQASTAILARQLARRFQLDPAAFLPLLGGLSLVQCEELSEKILDAERAARLEYALVTRREFSPFAETT